MSNKKSGKQAQEGTGFARSGNRAATSGSSPWGIFVSLGALVLVAVVVAVIVFARLKPPGDEKAGVPASFAGGGSLKVEPATPDTVWDPAWSPVPKGRSPRPIEQVRAAYAFAARRGDVLQYMPCYCGCEKQGHKSDESCFVKGKTAAGLPQWDSMGITCDICLSVAHETMQMLAQGKPLIEIRKAHDAKYKARYGTSTPTIYPPGSAEEQKQ